MVRKQKAIYKSIEKTLHDTAYSEFRDMSIDELADRMNVKSSLLYKALNPEDPSVRFPMSWATPFMQILNNFNPLRVLAANNGFMLVKAPTGSNSKLQNDIMLAEFNQDFAKLHTALLKFYGQPTLEAQKKLIKQLSRHMEKTAAIKLRVKRENGQPSLFNEEV